MKTQPLAEVFGFPPDNLSPEAEKYRQDKLCPFNNKIPYCTKDKKRDPIGVCSIHHGEDIVIVCPIRFRQDWRIVESAADFFFEEGATWIRLQEIRLKDKHGKSAGNIDIVLVAHDDQGRVIDFGALEVQSVYISGNDRAPFEYYMEDRARRKNMDWSKMPGSYPRPD